MCERFSGGNACEGERGGSCQTAVWSGLAEEEPGGRRTQEEESRSKVSAILHKAGDESWSHVSKQVDLQGWLFLLLP